MQSTKIATWNINSVRARLSNVLGWLALQQPDILLLQEIKCETQAFPLMELRLAGYAHCAIVGQKSYNGVAILSHIPLTVRHNTLPGDGGDPQARYVEVSAGGLIVASLYMPNGNPCPGEKYDYKLAWLERLQAHAETLRCEGRPVVLGGDFNIIPAAIDAANPAAWSEDALYRPEIRRHYAHLINRGWTDCWRALHAPPERGYTFWDYQNNAHARDDGIRIDHMLASPEAADCLIRADVERNVRAQDKASDHVPLVVELGRAF